MSPHTVGARLACDGTRQRTSTEGTSSSGSRRDRSESVAITNVGDRGIFFGGSRRTAKTESLAPPEFPPPRCLDPTCPAAGEKRFGETQRQKLAVGKCVPWRECGVRYGADDVITTMWHLFCKVQLSLANSTISITWLSGQSQTQFVHRPPSCPAAPLPAAIANSTPCCQ